MPTSTSCRAALRLRDAGMPHPGGPPTVCYGNVDGKKHFSPLCHLLLLQQPLRALAKRAAGSVAQSTTSHHRSRVLVDALSQVQAPTTRALLRVAVVALPGSMQPLAVTLVLRRTVTLKQLTVQRHWEGVTRAGAPIALAAAHAHCCTVSLHFQHSECGSPGQVPRASPPASWPGATASARHSA